MRILVISDIHSSVRSVKQIIEETKEVNVNLTLISGDITHFSRADALKILSAIPGKKAAVPGNCDAPDITEVFEETGTIDLHGKRAEIEGLVFAGLGASNPLPFSTLFTYSEERIFTILDSICNGADVLVTHTPPYGILDRTAFGHRGGSEAIRKVVEKYRPRLSIFGHIHESPGIEEKDGTVFVNPGPAKDGRFAIIDIDDKISAELHHLAEK